MPAVAAFGLLAKPSSKSTEGTRVESDANAPWPGVTLALGPNVTIRSNSPFDWKSSPGVPACVPFESCLHFNLTDHVDGDLHTLVWAAWYLFEVLPRFIKP